jgi:hypothetical protein
MLAWTRTAYQGCLNKTKYQARVTNQEERKKSKKQIGEDEGK